MQKLYEYVHRIFQKNEKESVSANMFNSAYGK